MEAERDRCGTCRYYVACDWNDRSVPLEYTCALQEEGKPCVYDVTDPPSGGERG